MTAPRAPMRGRVVPSSPPVWTATSRPDDEVNRAKPAYASPWRQRVAASDRRDSGPAWRSDGGRCRSRSGLGRSGQAAEDLVGRLDHGPALLTHEVPVGAGGQVVGGGAVPEVGVDDDPEASRGRRGSGRWSRCGLRAPRPGPRPPAPRRCDGRGSRRGPGGAATRELVTRPPSLFQERQRILAPTRSRAGVASYRSRTPGHRPHRTRRA